MDYFLYGSPLPVTCKGGNYFLKYTCKNKAVPPSWRHLARCGREKKEPGISPNGECAAFGAALLLLRLPDNESRQTVSGEQSCICHRVRLSVHLVSTCSVL